MARSELPYHLGFICDSPDACHAILLLNLSAVFVDFLLTYAGDIYRIGGVGYETHH